MAECNIYWKQEKYDLVERLLLQAKEYCGVHDTWRLNMAHCYFIQEGKYQESIQEYEVVYNKNINNLIELPAIVIANMCVSNIMVSMNE